jgi:multiple sugar transport system substrate-binding protein
MAEQHTRQAVHENVKLLLRTILVVALLLTACKSNDRPETPEVSPVPETAEAPQVEVERTTVLFAVYDWEMSRYDDLIGAFEDTNPELRVQLVSINEVLDLDPTSSQWPDDAWTRLASSADVINLQGGDQGVFRDLTPLIQADPTFQPEDFYPGALESQQREGGMWALPTLVHFDLIFFDKDAFDEAGEPYPEPGWTWDDFAATARALTLRQGDEVLRWGFVQPWSYHLTFIEVRVESLVDQSTDPPTPRLDQPEVIEAARWYADLYLTEKVAPYLPPPGSDEAQEQPAMSGAQLITARKAAMWRDSSSNWGRRKQQYDNLGVVPFPVDAPDSRTSTFWSQGLSMSAGTAHPEAAWRWMNFLSRQPHQDEENLPARRSAIEASGFWDKVDQELAVALRYAIDHSYLFKGADAYSELAAALDAVLAGEKSVEQALAEAQAIAQGGTGQQATATPAPTIAVAAPSEEPTVEGTVNITFIPGLASSDLKSYRDAAEQFQKIRPDIVVEIVPPDFESTLPSCQVWPSTPTASSGLPTLKTQKAARPSSTWNHSWTLIRRSAAMTFSRLSGKSSPGKDNCGPCHPR